MERGGKGNSSGWEKGLCLESFLWHDPHISITCNAPELQGNLEKNMRTSHIENAICKCLETSYSFSLGSSNVCGQLLGMFKGTEKKAATSTNRNAHPHFVLSYSHWSD